MARTSNRREFVQLAHTFDTSKHTINGWFYSEKLDGMRALWDGGITRGLYCDEIPFANVAKDGRLVSRPKSTGLWSRYGKPIAAPLWFIDALPPYPLDGELHTGRGEFQRTMSTVRKIDPIDSEWELVSYEVFDLPDASIMFADGRINVPNFEKQFSGIINWLHSQKRISSTYVSTPRRFETVVHLLEKHHGDELQIVCAVKQHQLPFSTAKAFETVYAELDRINDLGGEGLILRAPGSIWEPQRVHSCLKVKPWEDAEVTVTGYISGRETDRGSKLLGLMGAMIVDFNGKRLELSGFTDEERILTWTDADFKGHNQERASTYCEANPGMIVPETIFNRKFPRGSKITIRYRELTKDGLPKEARYWRPRPNE